MKAVLYRPIYSSFKLCCGLLMVVFVVAGCSTFPKATDDPGLKVEQLITAQQYTQALATIAGVEPSHAKYKQLQKVRQSILNRLKSLERSTLREVVMLKKNKQWVQALSVIDSVIEKIPTSEKLIVERKKIVSARDRYINELSISLSVLRAKTIPEAQSLLTKINLAKVDGGEIDSELDNLLLQASEARKILLHEANKSINEKRWPQAYSFIELADLLGVDGQSTALRKHIEVTIKSLKIKQLTQAIENNEFIKAQAITRDMHRFEKDQQVIALKKQLNNKIANTVTLLVKLGQKYYIEGLLDNAIESWQQALALDADNSDLEKRLLRAQLFKSNYKKFQGSH